MKRSWHARRVVSALLGLCATVSCAPCGTPPAPPLPDAATRPFVQIPCAAGLQYCQGSEVWRCDDSGRRAQQIKRCESSQSCLEGECQNNPLCDPGQAHCVDDRLARCRPDGSGYDLQSCAPADCAEQRCQESAPGVCPAGLPYCRDNAVALCNASGSGTVAPPTPCNTDRCVDGECLARVCEPGTARCQDNRVEVCDELGVGYFVFERCSEGQFCSAGRCRTRLCPATTVCFGDQLLYCNDDGSEIIGQVGCGSAGCSQGACLGRDAGPVQHFDGPIADMQELPDLRPRDRRVTEHDNTDRSPDDRLVPEPSLRDGGGRDDGPVTQLDCTLVPCIGLSYCDPVSRTCRDGCDSDIQCPGQRCDRGLHQCVGVGPSSDAGAGEGGSARDAQIAGVDGAGSYTPDGGGVIIEELCPASSQVSPGCMAEMDEGTLGWCDGLDNDCDGAVDEGCPCLLGQVQRCFRGPPGRRNVGACEDGQQICVSRITSRARPPVWGPCQGGIAPRGEVCDDLDNDCNGCVDEIDGCSGVGSCPGPGDPRVPDGRPFSRYPLNGAQFYPGDDAMSWRWHVQGTPCDQKFLRLPGSTASPENGQLSFRLRNGDQRDADLNFTLSGDYRVSLDVGLRSGAVFSCTWIVHVRAPGLRVELCWDVTGPTAEPLGGPLDIDLHLARHGTTTRWFDSSDCDYSTCQAQLNGLDPNWGYLPSPIDNCTGPGSRGSFDNNCPNPRLDIDNIWEQASYVPENINLDKPNDGDRFRVMVHHFDMGDRAAKPLVNVYCGGELRGTYGAPPDEVLGFDRGGGREAGSMWRVVDIETSSQPGRRGTSCALTPLTDPTGEGYYLTVSDTRL